MRQALALVGALALALLLFWGLARMVAPPHPAETPQKSMTMSVVDEVAAPALAPDNSAQMAAAAPPPPPPAAPARPTPVPQPAENVQSDIQLQTRDDVAEPEAPEVEMNNNLPELDVAKPEPRPRPQPQPTPSPAPPREAAPVPATQGSQQSRQQGQTSGGTPQGAPAQQGGGTTQAQPTSRVQPEYPMRARRRGEEGFVEMQFMIRTDGSVDASSIRITASQPSGVFDRAARDAVRQWQFPSRDAPAQTRQRLVFKLR